MKIGRMIGAAAMAACLSLGMQAGAATLSSVAGTWTEAGSDDVFGLSALGRNEVTWGAPVHGDRQSGYRFDANPAVPLTGIDPDQRFEIGTFTHMNREIYRQGERTNGRASSISEATLSVRFGLDFNGVSRSYTSIFSFQHLETRNQDATCANGGANGTGVNGNGCADRVTLVLDQTQSDTFTIDGVTYQLDATGLGAEEPFWTPEYRDTSLALSGIFRVVEETGGGESPVGPPGPNGPEGPGGPDEPAPIPLPATLPILALGVASLAFLRRRR